MLSILSKTFRTATRQQDWDAPDHWEAHRRPNNSRQAARIEAERKMVQFRNTGFW